MTSALDPDSRASGLNGLASSMNDNTTARACLTRPTLV